MKIDRRSFLSLSIGGAAGTVLSPLPWKLQDDSSIWSQMWPWTPVPEDGEVTYVDSTCALCPGGCGITVRKVNDRAVKIEGMQGHPVNDGGICTLGLSGLQLLYGPTRVKTPLKRVGNRGEGQWQKISWQDALAEIAAKLKALRANGQAHTLGCLTGADQGTVPQLMSRFLTVYGSPNLLRIPSMQDGYKLALSRMNGVRARVGFDFEHTNFVLSFGSGIIDGWGSPVYMFKTNSRWKENNVKLVQVESRLSNTAAKSDKWLPINPGTEATLALGLANVIVSRSLYNKEFAETYSKGFAAFKTALLEDYSLEKVEKITGVDKASIISLAKRFAQASRPIAVCGRGQGSAAGSAAEFMAVHALNALVGNVNKPGGVWAVPEPAYIEWPEVEIDDAAAAGIQSDRVDGAGTEDYPDVQSLLNRFIDGNAAGNSSMLEVLLITGANPRYSQPNTPAVKAAFDKIPLVVSCSSWMDETTQYADLVLPNHVYLESYEDVPDAAGVPQPVLGLAKPVVEPQFNTKHVGDVIIELAKALGGTIAEAFAWENYEACLEETLGRNWDTLQNQTYLIDTDYAAADWQTAFETKSGKFAFTSAAFPTFTPVQPEGEPNFYPLVLIPYDSFRLAHGYIGDPPFMIKTVPDTVLKRKDSFIEVNPKTAKQYRLSEGKYAIISTPKGKAKVRVHLFEGIMPGVVAMPRGLGHTAYDKYLAGKGVNINGLIGSIEDPGSGLNAAWGIRAKLTKA